MQQPPQNTPGPQAPQSQPPQQSYPQQQPSQYQQPSYSQQPQYPPQYQYPPQPQVVQVVQKRNSCLVPALIIGGVLVVGLIALCGIISLTAKNSTTTTTTQSSVLANGSPVPTVEGPSYADYTSKHSSMTDAQWATYIKTLDSNHISNWQGWVYDVVRDSDTVYDLKIDQDGPNETLATADVDIKISVSDAANFNKHQKVTYSGTIDHIDCNFGYCVVDVRDATLTPSQ